MDDAPVIPAEVAAALWVERATRAQDWGEPAGDAPEPLALPGPGREPGVEGEALHRELLVSQWEHAVAQVARWEAVKQRVLAEALDHALTDGTDGATPQLRVRSMAAELAVTAGISDRTITAQMGDAAALRDRYPATWDAFAGGRVSRPQVGVIIDEGARLDDPAARAEYETLVLDLATQPTTTGRLRAAAKAIAEQLNPTTLTERHREAREARRVDVRADQDGMGTVTAHIPAALAFGVHDRLTQMALIIRDTEHTAHAAAADGDPAADGADPVPVVRTLDQIRADLFSDLLLTGHPTAPDADRDGGDGLGALRGIVQITLPATTLTRSQSRVPAVLAGRCPIDPDTARHLAGTTGLWERVLTDPATGAVVATDRRFPTAAQRRHLQARDEHCRFPGCRMPVWRCDIDHTTDHAHGGKTTVCNLAHLCRRHHMLKHHTHWTVTQADDGTLTWTSPTGRVYTDRAPPTIRFLPEPGIA